MLAHAEPVEGVLIQIEERQTAEHATGLVEADEGRGEGVEAGLEVVHAALHARDVEALVGVDGAVVVADFEEFAAVVEGEFVVVFAGAVDDDAVGLGEGFESVFDASSDGAGVEGVVLGGLAGAVVAGAEEHQVPVAALDFG